MTNSNFDPMALRVAATSIGRSLRPSFMVALTSIMTLLVLAFAVTSQAAGNSVASANGGGHGWGNGGCIDIDDDWIVDENGVSHVVSGPMKGSIEVTEFVPGDIVFPFLHWTGAATYDLRGGEAFATLAGTINVETAEVDFVNTIQGGTGRWAGVSGSVHVIGVDQVGGTSEGVICRTGGNRCQNIDDDWKVDKNGVSHVVSGPMRGSIEVTEFIPGDLVFPFLHWTGAATYDLEGGEVFGALAGTINVETAEVDFVNTIQGGTGRWAGVSGSVHVIGVDQVGGTSEGVICLPGNRRRGNDNH